MVRLTPLDIHNKNFTKKIKGYNEDEVHLFLNEITKDYEVLMRESSDKKTEIKQLTERLEHFVNIEITLNKPILIAQETAEQLKTNARKEAKLIIKEAENNADRIINEALSKSRQVNSEVKELKKQGKIFRTRLKKLVETQLEIIGTDDWDELFNSPIKENIELVE